MPEISKPVAPDGQSDVFHSDALPAGALLGEFEIRSLLGVGGFGMVYSAYDRALRRSVAIKEYLPSTLAGRVNGLEVASRSSVDEEAFASGLRSFVTEARLLAQFDHPSLVKVYRFWEANHTAYMVMPLYRGVTFRQARSYMNSPPSEAWLRTVLWALLGALKYMHDHNTVHRDISPDNIFLQDKGPPVLLDLGAARRAMGDASQRHTAVLKVNYAPIEQYAESVDMQQGPWTDLYSLAAVVHGCLCNASPLPATFRVVRDRMPRIASVTRTIQSVFGMRYSRKFVKTIDHALSLQPEDRPQSVQGFLDEMELVAPQGLETFIWRAGLDLGTRPVQRSDFGDETVTHNRATDEESASKPAPPVPKEVPLEHVSAYGVLEEESAFLATELALETGAVPLDSHTAEIEPSHVPVRRVRRRHVYAFATVVGLAVALSGLIWSALKPSKEAPVAAGLAPNPSQQVAPAELAIKATPPFGSSTVAVSEAAVATSAPVATTLPASLPNVATEQQKFSSTNPLELKPAPLPARTRKDSTAKTAPVVPKLTRAPTQALVVSPPGPVAVVADRPVVVAAPAELLPAKPAAAGPLEICASKNFFVRPMCIYQECEKPAFMRTAFCEDNRRRLKEGNLANRP